MARPVGRDPALPATYLPCHSVLDDTIEDFWPYRHLSIWPAGVPGMLGRGDSPRPGPSGPLFHDRPRPRKTGARPPRKASPPGTPAQAAATEIKDAPAMHEVSGRETDRASSASLDNCSFRPPGTSTAPPQPNGRHDASALPALPSARKSATRIERARPSREACSTDRARTGRCTISSTWPPVPGTLRRARGHGETMPSLAEIWGVHTGQGTCDGVCGIARLGGENLGGSSRVKRSHTRPRSPVNAIACAIHRPAAMHPFGFEGETEGSRIICSAGRLYCL